MWYGKTRSGQPTLFLIIFMGDHWIFADGLSVSISSVWSRVFMDSCWRTAALPAGSTRLGSLLALSLLAEIFRRRQAGRHQLFFMGNHWEWRRDGEIKRVASISSIARHYSLLKGESLKYINRYTRAGFYTARGSPTTSCPWRWGVAAVFGTNEPREIKTTPGIGRAPPTPTY